MTYVHVKEDCKYRKSPVNKSTADKNVPFLLMLESTLTSWGTVRAKQQLSDRTFCFLMLSLLAQKLVEIRPNVN